MTQYFHLGSDSSCCPALGMLQGQWTVGMNLNNNKKWKVSHMWIDDKHVSEAKNYGFSNFVHVTYNWEIE